MLHYLGTTPVDGTDEVQTLTIGGTPDGGTMKYGFKGYVTPPISWDADNATLLANINAALRGTLEVWTLTFAGTITGGKFMLGIAGQRTAEIDWSSTNNTLRDNVDAALELLLNVGTGGVTTAVGTMTNGIGTLTVTFAVSGPQSPIDVVENRLTGAGASVRTARTTPGTYLASAGADGIVATAGTLLAGIGTILLTFSGANVAKRAQPLMTIEENALTGTDPTLAIEETTPGVDASLMGAQADALLIGDDELYINAGTPAAPTWTLVGPV